MSLEQLLASAEEGKWQLKLQQLQQVKGHTQQVNPATTSRQRPDGTLERVISVDVDADTVAAPAGSVGDATPAKYALEDFGDNVTGSPRSRSTVGGGGGNTENLIPLAADGGVSPAIIIDDSASMSKQTVQAIRFLHKTGR